MRVTSGGNYDNYKEFIEFQRDSLFAVGMIRRFRTVMARECNNRIPQRIGGIATDVPKMTTPIDKPDLQIPPSSENPTANDKTAHAGQQGNSDGLPVIPPTLQLGRKRFYFAETLFDVMRPTDIIHTRQE